MPTMYYLLRLTAAKHALRLSTSEDLARLADQYLDRGVYTPLAELILSRNPGWVSVEELVRRTLRQLGVEPLEQQAAVNFLTRHYLWRIAEKSVPAIDGVDLLIEEFYKPLFWYATPRGISDSHLSPLVSDYYSIEHDRTLIEVHYISAEEGQRIMDGRAASILAFVTDWVQQHCLPPLDPAWLTWNDGTVPRLAQTIRDELTFDCLPVLADALEEAGCNGRDVLDHCRCPGDHLRDCWVLDWLLAQD
jgi:hypothetical protein